MMTARAFVDEVVEQFPELRPEVESDYAFLVRFGAELDEQGVPQLHVWNVARTYGERVRGLLDETGRAHTRLTRVFDLLERALTSGSPDMDIAIGKDFLAELFPEHSVDRGTLALVGPATSALIRKTCSVRN